MCSGQSFDEQYYYVLVVEAFLSYGHVHKLMMGKSSVEVTAKFEIWNPAYVQVCNIQHLKLLQTPHPHPTKNIIILVQN